MKRKRAEVNSRNPQWAAIRIVLILLYLGVLPLTPDLPLPFVFAALALALVAAAPVILRCTRVLSQYFGMIPRGNTQAAAERDQSPDCWRVLLPTAPGRPGHVLTRAPSLLAAAHG